MNPVEQWAGYDILCDGELDLECREVEPATPPEQTPIAPEALFSVFLILAALLVMAFYRRKSR